MTKFNTLSTITIGTILLSIIGLYNGYPLVYSDTGTYIYSGFDLFIPNDRTITYGLFLRFFSLNYSAWFVIIMQNLITAFVLFEAVKLFDFPNEIFKRVYLFTIFFLVLFTGIGWYSNQLMPDFFTPIMILSIFIILKRPKFTMSTGIILLIILYSLITHFSHLLIGSAILSSIILLKIVFKKFVDDISFKRLIFVSLLVFSSWIILPCINYIVEKQFILSKGSHVFLMAHLNDTGILKEFLDENCSNNEFKDCTLCQQKDSLPVDLATFIWSSPVLEKTGGWIDSKDEYNKIISATLTQPKYLFLNIYRAFTSGLIQLTKNEIGQGLTAYNEGSAPYGQIHWRFNNELNNYLNDRQNKFDGVNLKFDTLNMIHLFVLVLSIFVLILLYTSSILGQMDSISKIFIEFILLSIVLNSFITAGLNAPCERFQARVVWLLPFSIIILLVKNYKIIVNTFYKTYMINDK